MGLFKRKQIEKRSISEFTEAYDVLEIRVPKNINDRNELRTAPIAAEHLFASLHGLLREDSMKQEHISLEMVATEGTIRFYVAVPSSVSRFVESQIYAQYPTSHITTVSDYIPTGGFKHGEYKVANLTLSKPNYFPLKTFRDFEIDPLSAITSAMSEAMVGENIWFQMLVRPLPDIWQGEGHKYIASINEGTPLKTPNLGKDIVSDIKGELGAFTQTFFDNLSGKIDDNYYKSSSKGSDRVILTSSQELEIKSIEQKLSKMGFEVVFRVLAQAETEERTDSLLRSTVASTRQFSTANLNSFTSSIRTNDELRFDEYKERIFNPKSSFILNIEELGSIYHLPTTAVETPGVSWVHSKKGEPPADLPIDNCNFIGSTLFRDRKIKFGLSNENDDRVRHMYLIGKSGTGKTTLFKNMIAQDIANGAGVGVVDPHGDLIEDILEYIPDNRIEDVVIFDPSDTQYPVGVNLLELNDPEQKNLMASALVSSMKQYFWSWGPRLEYLLNYAVLTLLEVPGTSMLGITRLLTDMNYQAYILEQIDDPVVLDFWEEEYAAMRGNQRLITEAVAPIQNKINRFLSSTTIRNIVGQRNSTIDFWDIMNNKKILLLNLSKGKIGQDNANLLGALIVSRLQFMAMQRVNMPMSERNPFYLYVDEFQNFVGGDFESILSEARKFQLGLYLTHQYTSQLPEELLSAIFGNVGTMVSYSVGAQDAKILETEFAPQFDENDLISLPKFNVYIKLMVDGQTSRPFSAQVNKPWIPEESLAKTYPENKAKVIARSREKFGSDREYIEQKIRKWVGYDFDKGKAIAAKYNREKAQKLKDQSADSTKEGDSK